MLEDSAPTLIDLFEKEMAPLSEKIEFLVSSVPSCQILRHLRNQHFITLDKCRSVEYRRKRMINYYKVLSSRMGRYQDVTMEEFEDFLKKAKSALDSLAKEINIIFCIIKQKATFNTGDFINNLQKEDAQLSNDIKQICERDDWFTYFLKLRNQSTHTGKIITSPYIEVKTIRDIAIKPVFKKIEGEIQDIPKNNLTKEPFLKKDDAIQDVGFYLPDNPEESDSSKVTYNRKIKFKNYHIDLSQKIYLLFKTCYQEINNELNRMQKNISNKKCLKNKCNQRNCSLKKKIIKNF